MRAELLGFFVAFTLFSIAALLIVVGADELNRRAPVVIVPQRVVKTVAINVDDEIDRQWGAE